MLRASTKQDRILARFRAGSIPELEVSVTAACSLACADCGFFVPRQPAPWDGDPRRAFGDALACLGRAAVEIESLAVLGGEATLAPGLLADVLQVARRAEFVARVELVTNGLTPKGLPLAALASIDRLSLSDYTDDDALGEAWRSWLARHTPQVEFVVRRHSQWDAVN
ncbi:MAG: hypothetical protein KC431_03755, partial [Myxococcales bacterium]|nr:hypothetical protein [Myxococcales bacterium]